MSLAIAAHDGLAVLTLDRAQLRNAFDDRLIAALTDAYDAAARDPAIRAVLLRASGPVFSAGADLGWMQRMAAAGEAENLADARKLAALMRAVDTCPKPTIARIQGSAFGGALGLIAASDIAIAVPEAEFGLSEVRLGLIPAVIAPYLLRGIGARAARRWFLTAERFPAAEALRLGLVHEIVPEPELDAAIARQVAALRRGGPLALAAAKRLIADVAGAIDASLIEDTAARIAAIRAAPEAREGLAAFLEKRQPRWAP